MILVDYNCHFVEKQYHQQYKLIFKLLYEVEYTLRNSEQ